ncbi:SixA phosphatase family protein [Halpernia frigidisoli]|uniref:Phosphohistidine phosphatase n=1 Tax=Halpernia frigidisoli TaxID=1125876 RepID=A0A1I3F7E7_9FLAO|nr:histidine phosphatase family protein [Halpernia frigidisoli]SFI07093.1 phosphohistidine phosphatase [Halpernia frigidisoli]
MKTLILVRHAKSDWPEDTEDFDRPLAERGIKDATEMAKNLFEKELKVDYFLTSPAKRTVETCDIFSKKYGKSFETAEKLYHPSEKNFLSVILSLDDSNEAVAVFSHNNGISNFANSLSEDIVHFPTCGVALYNIDCEQWSNFENAEKKLVAFFKP